MIQIEQRGDGVIIAVKAQPGARHNAIGGEHAGMLKVKVAQKADDGKANEAVIALLAKKLNVAKSDCRICSGRTSRQKRIRIAGITLHEAMERLEIGIEK